MHEVVWKRLRGDGMDACRVLLTAPGWTHNYHATLSVDDFGAIVDYPGLWVAVKSA